MVSEDKKVPYKAIFKINRNPVGYCWFGYIFKHRTHNSQNIVVIKSVRATFAMKNLKSPFNFELNLLSKRITNEPMKPIMDTIPRTIDKGRIYEAAACGMIT